jgi:hypothetical protein
MTLVTGIVQRLSNQLRLAGRTVRAVTASTSHLAFHKRVRKRFQCFVALQLMAIETNLGLCRRLHHGIAGCMADVAIGTGHFVNVMCTAVPAESGIRIVASKAHAVLHAYFRFFVRTKFDHWWAFRTAP